MKRYMLILFLLPYFSIYSNEIVLNYEQWKTFNGEDWALINIDSIDNSDKHIVLKNEVFLNHTDYSYIIIPEILMFDRTYINGIEVGNLFIEDFSNFMGGREYYVPSGVLKVGLNTIVIELSWLDKLNGTLSKEISLLSKDKYTKIHNKNNFIWNIVPILFVTLFFLCAVYLMIKFLFNRGAKYYIYMSLRLILISLSFLAVSSPIKIFSVYNIITVWNIVIILLFINITLYYQSLTKRYLHKFNIVLTLLLFLGLINSFVLLTVLILTLLFNLQTLNSLEKKGDSYILYIHSLIDLLGVFLVSATIVIYIAFPNFDAGSIMMLSSLIISVNYILMHIRLDALNKKRYESIQEKVRSDKGEERVLEVIQYIDANIESTLYRDELAASIGYTPSYFSTIFNSITGKSFSVYVNELRVKKAIEFMNDPKLKISYIAFEVGFESISTFNRVFKSIHGVPPSKYRKLSIH